jgi:cytochrome c553
MRDMANARERHLRRYDRMEEHHMEIMRTRTNGGLFRLLPVSLAAALFAVFVAVPSVSFADEIDSKIARGGRLYDKWFKFTTGDLPSGTHASYPKAGKKRKKATWRCKECHGWDYMGKDGAYGEGSHFSGIKGIRGSAGAPTKKIIGVLKSKSHGFTDALFKPDDFRDVALFVSKGQLDMDKHIDRATKKVKGGDKNKGAAYYNTMCANCHGRDGKKPKDMSDTVGEVASANPWETLHKIRNGQPDEKMPALRAFPLQAAIDILSYAQTLPK